MQTGVVHCFKNLTVHHEMLWTHTPPIVANAVHGMKRAKVWLAKTLVCKKP